MKKAILSLAATLTLALFTSAEADAQFTVWKGGQVVYSIKNGRADYISFDYSAVGSVAVGGEVPDVSEAVDLGLTSGTLWAPWNIGAWNSGQAGAYIAWGETATKDYFYEKNYKHLAVGGHNFADYEKYQVEDGRVTCCWYTDSVFTGDGKLTLDAEDDAAIQNWGGKWSMPTVAQFKELYTECDREWKEANWDGKGSLAGVLLTSKKNGNTLFLPAAGWKAYEKSGEEGEHGYYWSTELSTSTLMAKTLWVSSLSFRSDSPHMRYEGFTIRPVVSPTE